MGSNARWLAVVCMLMTPLASAEIYKCPGKDGSDLYQNFPCDIDSIGSVATNPAPQVDATRAKAASAAIPPAVLATAGKVSMVSDIPRVGMTLDEVRGIWGDPATDVSSEIADGLVEIWTYPGARSVTFDYKGLVSVVSRGP